MTDRKWVVNLQGRDYITYPGLLNAAHDKGLQSIDVTLEQAPCAENDFTAICTACVKLKDGQTFTEIGDASPRNVNAKIASALIRMAATRAKGRALRDAVNVGETMAEEIAPDDVAQPTAPWQSGQNYHKRAAMPQPPPERRR